MCGYESRVSKDLDENRDHHVYELERENEEKEKEIAGRMKISGVVEAILQENKLLKEKLDEMENEKNEIVEKCKFTHRRLSRSYEPEIELNDTVSQEMFSEKSSNSPPFHGFSSSDQSGVDEVQDNVIKIAPIKRALSDPCAEAKKRYGRHPVVGSKILVDAIDSKGVFTVKSKKTPSESDFIYFLEKDKKEHTLNLKRIKWVMFDGGEKIPLKSTV